MKFQINTVYFRLGAQYETEDSNWLSQISLTDPLMFADPGKNIFYIHDVHQTLPTEPVFFV